MYWEKFVSVRKTRTILMSVFMLSVCNLTILKALCALFYSSQWQEYYTQGLDSVLCAQTSALFIQSAYKKTSKALSRKVQTSWISLQHSPIQGYVLEGRLRVIQSSLALATNEEGALVKVGKVAILEWAWLMWAQQHAAALTPGPLQTAAAATGRKRKWVDLGGHRDKMLNNSSKALWVVGQGHMREHRGGLLLPCIIWIQWLNA